MVKERDHNIPKAVLNIPESMRSFYERDKIRREFVFLVCFAASNG
jgi:hypothetical protein